MAAVKRGSADTHVALSQMKIARVQQKDTGSQIHGAVMRTLYTLVRTAIMAVDVDVDDSDLKFMHNVCKAVNEKVEKYCMRVKTVPLTETRIPVPKFPAAPVLCLLHDVAGCFVRMLQYAAFHAMKNIHQHVQQCDDGDGLLTLFCEYLKTAENTYADIHDVYEECKRPVKVFFEQRNVFEPNFDFWVCMCVAKLLFIF